jgi:enediyne biosynthesis protein E4
MSKHLIFLVITFSISLAAFSQKFTVLKPEETGIYFRSNTNMTTAPFEGSGVGVADFDNDGLTDIFFAGSPESKLYRNKGNMQFEDITISSGIKTGNGATSVAIADLNNDGWNDIVVGKSKRFNNDTITQCFDLHESEKWKV